MILIRQITKITTQILILLLIINPLCLTAANGTTIIANNSAPIVDKPLGQAASDNSNEDNKKLTDKEKELQFTNRMLNYYWQNGKASGPEWLKTTDLQLRLTDNNKLMYSFETIQPFAKVGENGQLWFWQGRYAHESGNSSTANIGFGWRKLSADKSRIVGINTFYDYGFKYNLARVGLGVEYFNKLAEYRANWYHPLSGEKLTGVDYQSNGILYSYIRAVEGVDFEAGTSFTHLPWLKLFAGGYYWDNKYNPDEKGYRLRSMMQLTPRVNMELGYIHSNLSHDVYGNIKYQLALGASQSQEGSKAGKDNNNDISYKLLQKVERENDIKTETFTKFVAYTGSIKATVTNSNNNTPISGVMVQAYQNGTAVGSAAVTDASGNAVISGLAVGSYIVYVTYGQSYTGTSNTVTVTKDTTAAAAVSLAVSGGSAKVKVMSAQSAAISGATVTAILSNTTVASAGKGILDVIFGVKSAYAASSSFSVVATTDSSGVASFTNLPPGTYTFKATKNELSMTSEAVAVDANGLVNTTMMMPTSGGNIHAVVKNSNGAVMQGSLVKVLSGTTAITSGTTDSNGVVILGGIAAGTYTVSAFLSGYIINTTSVTVMDGATANSTISLIADSFTITASAETGGSISPNGATSVSYGATPTYTITPNTGYVIADVKVDGVSVGTGSTYTFPSVTGNHAITATFVLQSFTITASAGANGSISPSGANGVSYGATPTYTITPNVGYVIDDVKVDGVSVGTPGSYTFASVTGNHTIAATFTQQTFTITASAGANGTISPNGTASVNYGSARTYTITPNVGYVIAAVKVDGVSVGTPGSYTFPSVTGNHTIAATFAKSYAISITNSKNALVKIENNTALYVNTWTDSAINITVREGDSLRIVIGNVIVHYGTVNSNLTYNAADYGV